MDSTAGWMGTILRVDLSRKTFTETATRDYAERFIGGRGIAAKVYWDEVSPDVGAFDPENPLILMTGPLCGTGAVGGSRWVVAGKSPLMHPDQYGMTNLGGTMGPAIKAAGYDGMVITGRSDTPACLVVDEGRVTFDDAGPLWGLETQVALQRLKGRYGKTSQSLTIGPAGENLVRLAVAVGEQGASCGSGFGAVMGSKNLKAVVVRGSGRVRIAHPNDLKDVNARIRSLIGEKFLSDPNIEGIELVRRASCSGCPAGCPRGLYKHDTGTEEYLKNCQSTYVYYTWDRLFYNGEPTTNPFLVTSLCNRLGLCTQEMSNIFRLLNLCREEGVDLGGFDVSRMGSLDFAENLLRSMSSRTGFGNILARGTIRAAQALGPDAEALLERFVTPSGFHAHEYSPRYFVTNGVFYATEATSPLNHLHEIIFPLMKWVMWYATDGTMNPFSTDVMRAMARRFWGIPDAADFTSYVGKGPVAKLIQDRNFAKENLVVCDFLYPMLIALGAEDFLGEPDLESRLLSAVTGTDVSEAAYYRTGERVFNLQRAIQGCEGRCGRKDDVLNEVNFTEGLEVDEGFFGIWNPDFMVPGPGGEIVSRKGAVVDREQFTRMMDDYYSARGWDVVSGLQKRDTLIDLDLGDIVSDLETRGLVCKE